MYIKREDAIKTLAEILYEEPPYLNSAEKRMAFARNALKDIPSAEKQGEWIPYEAPLNFGDGEYYVNEHKCSACGYPWGEPDYKYCPECGARMKGADDDAD